MTETTNEKLFNLYDSQSDDDEILYTMTLDGIRQWLADLWNDNPDEEMNEEEHEELIEDILCADEAEMHDRLAGVGYHMEEV